MVTLYNVISSDGFIAGKNGNEDFIPDEFWPVTLNFFKKYDAFVMGRRTYDAMQKYPKELLSSFQELPFKKIVVTSDRTNFHPDPRLGYIVAHSPQDALVLGSDVLVSSGPTLNEFLLEYGLVDMVVHHEIPIRIGEGIRPFDIKFTERLFPVSERILANGIKELVYEIHK